MAGVYWGAAIVGINNSLWGGCNWGRGSVNINVNRDHNIKVSIRHINNTNNSFKHNPKRRKDVPCRDAKCREAFKGKDVQRDADRARASEALKDRGPTRPRA